MARSQLERIAIDMELQAASDRRRADSAGMAGTVGKIADAGLAEMPGLKGFAAIRAAIGNFLSVLPKFLVQVLRSLPGLVATALAVSFGAPFWFDILSSLVKLGGTNASVRYSGVKPGAKKE
jgi:hypothetical protein